MIESQTSSAFGTATATMSCNLAPTTMILDEELTFNDSNVWSSFARPLIMIFCILMGTPIISTSLSLSCPIVDESGIDTMYLSLLCIMANSTDGESTLTTTAAAAVAAAAASSSFLLPQQTSTFASSSASSWPLIFSEKKK